MFFLFGRLQQIFFSVCFLRFFHVLRHSFFIKLCFHFTCDFVARFFSTSSSLSTLRDPPCRRLNVANTCINDTLWSKFEIVHTKLLAITQLTLLPIASYHNAQPNHGKPNRLIYFRHRKFNALFVFFFLFIHVLLFKTEMNALNYIVRFCFCSCFISI